jgi:hypothetical protein
MIEQFYLYILEFYVNKKKTRIVLSFQIVRGEEGTKHTLGEGSIFEEKKKKEI